MRDIDGKEMVGARGVSEGCDSVREMGGNDYTYLGGMQNAYLTSDALASGSLTH
jgi:hypothetical protein